MLASIFYGNTAIVRNRKISQNKHSYSAHTSRQVSILGVVRGKGMHPFCRCVAIGAIKIISQVTNSGSGPYLSRGGGEDWPAIFLWFPLICDWQSTFFMHPPFILCFILCWWRLISPPFALKTTWSPQNPQTPPLKKLLVPKQGWVISVEQNQYNFLRCDWCVTCFIIH